MKGDLRGIVLAAALVLALGQTAWAQGKVTHPDPRAARVVAVVVTGVGEAQGELTVSYPTKVERAQAEADLATMQAHGGWHLSAPQLADSKGETQVVARMTPGPAVSGGQDAVVWPLVLALKRYDRIGVALLGQLAAEPAGRVDNAYVHAVWSGGAGLSSFDVTVRDRSFSRAEQLRKGSRLEDPATGATLTAPAAGFRPPLWAWVVAALVLAGLAYGVVSRLGQGRDGTERQRASTARAWRARRARNMYR